MFEMLFRFIDKQFHVIDILNICVYFSIFIYEFLVSFVFFVQGPGWLNELGRWI